MGDAVSSRAGTAPGRDRPSIQAWGAMAFVLIGVIWVGAHFGPRVVTSGLPSCESSGAQTAVRDAMRNAPMGQMGISIIAFKELAVVSKGEERVDCSGQVLLTNGLTAPITYVFYVDRSFQPAQVLVRANVDLLNGKAD